MTDENKFSITLISAADKYGGLINFTNVLSVPHLLKGGDWYCSLRSIYMHNEFVSTTEAVGYKILIDIINPFPSKEPIIYIVPTNKSTNKTPIFFVPRTREEYPVTVATITQIHARIEPIDKFGNSIQEFHFETGQPTVIELSFENKMFRGDVKRVFRVYSKESSTKDNDFDDSNTNARFTCKTNDAFSMQEDISEFSLAIKSISFTPQFTWGKNKAIEISRGQPDGIVYDKKVVGRVNLLNNVTNAEIEEELIKLFDGLKTGDEESFPVYFHISKYTGKVEIAASKEIVIQMPQWFAYNLGLRKFHVPRKIETVDSNSKGMQYVTISFSGDLARKYKFQEKPNMNAFGPEIGFIYCDAIKASQIGGVFAPILATFPVPKKKTGEHFTYTYDNPEYLPVAKLDLSLLRFSLRDASGQLLPLKEGGDTGVVTMTLILKRKY